jgi:NAD(P)-dependent dehydrogenase (short-subunit alcohol dehydrogenase family)
MSFAGQVAFITGGVTGIGLGVAQAFSDAGLRLALSYRNEDHRAQTAAWFAQKSREEPLFIKLDVTDRAAFAAAAEQVEAHFGAVHVLVNNAGVSVFGPTDEASYADYDWIMGVNFGGVVNGLVSFLPKLKAATGRRHVVNVASMAAFLPGPQAGIYTASKFAVRGLTESLRYNLAPHGIGCSLCCPALTRTNAWDSALKRPEAFAQSGFAPVERSELEQFGTAFEAGMDPYEVGTKILRGMERGDGVIFTHPEFADDFREIYEKSVAALPDEEAPPERLAIENLRRAAMAAAEAGTVIGLGDLT